APVEGEMKERQEAIWQGRRHVDQHVAARDQIDPGKWRVRSHVLWREYAHFANLLLDAVGALLLDEEPVQSLRADVRLDAFGVHTAAGLFQGVDTGHIGPEHLNGSLDLRAPEVFDERDGH